MKGKLAAWKPDTSYRNMKMVEKDCSLGLEGSGSSDSALDDEILQEILREDEEKRKLQEEEDAAD